MTEQVGVQLSQFYITGAKQLRLKSPSRASEPPEGRLTWTSSRTNGRVSEASHEYNTHHFLYQLLLL